MSANANEYQPPSASPAAQSRPETANPNRLHSLRSDPVANREGLDLLRRLHGGHSGERLVASLKEVRPDFATMTIDLALAGVMGVLDWI